MLTLLKLHLILPATATQIIQAMSNSSFKTLESKVDELIKLCSDMRKENQMLRDKEHQWRNERETLLGKNQLARVRLEKVLRRLKTLEEGQA